MANPFTGKRIIITGASSGIGAELACQLASQGARLVLAARREPELQAVAAACRERGGEALVVPTDVTSEEQCRHLSEQAIAAWGGLDLLVNNAGISMRKLFAEMDDLSVLADIMAVNYLGSVYCTYYALPHLLQSRGRIVVTSSLAGKVGAPTRSGYSASKHALHGFFDALRVELAGSGVSVTLVCPGFVDTGIRRYGEDGAAEPRGMAVEVCAGKIVRAAARRRRELVMTPLGKVGRFIKPFLPGLIDRVARRKVGLP